MTPLCTDDFGNEVHRCHWSGRPVAVPDLVWTSGFVPGVKLKLPAAPDYEPHRKAHFRLYCESEANCNTCRHLIRQQHPKDPHGFLRGRCGGVPLKPNITFHPDDPMHMPCWKPRP